MTEKWRAIIIDDEAKARKLLQSLIEEYCPAVQIIQTAADVPEGVLAIKKHQPDIVFLDIDMPIYNGFQLFEFLDEVNFSIIFTTGFSEYAVKAFRYCAIDFLLKPIAVDQLIEAVEKVNKKESASQQVKIKEVTNSIRNKSIDRIALPSKTGYDFINLSDILYLTADGPYTEFTLQDGKNQLVSRTMKEYVNLLDPKQFIRIHRSYLVNINAIRRLSKTEGGFVVMSNGKSLPISKEAKDLLQNLFN